MTTPTKSQPAKSRANQSETPKTPEVEKTEKSETEPKVLKYDEKGNVDENGKFDENGFDLRIPVSLRAPILSEFARTYLEIADAISEYNKKVLAEKDAEWTTPKVLEKAKELAHPTDANIPADPDVQKAYVNFERLMTELSKARKNVIDVTASQLGISISAVVTRDEDEEKPLKEMRKRAATIGSQLSGMAEMTTDREAAAAVNGFLASYALPAIGRDQARSFSSTGGNAPKYRVHIKVIKNGQEIVSEDGFTKASQAMTKHWERGKAPKADKLREMWESAGNTSDSTKVPTVEVDSDGAHFVITKR